MHRNLIKLAAIATAALVVAGSAAAVAPTSDPSLPRDGWSSYAGSASKPAATVNERHRDGWTAYANKRDTRAPGLGRSVVRDTRPPGLLGRSVVRDGWYATEAASRARREQRGALVAGRAEATAAAYQSFEAARSATSVEAARAEAVSASPASDRFHWGDFGMGVTAALLSMLLLAALVLAARQRRGPRTAGL